MHVSILIPKGNVVVSSIMGAIKIFNSTNQYLMQSGQRETPLFEVDLVGQDKEADYYDGMITFRASKTIDEIDKTDIIVVTTITGDMQEALKTNKGFIPWIREQRVSNNAEVASLCMGAFLLAETGLLNGKSAATHWMGHEQFRLMYPEVELIEDKIITEDNGIYMPARPRRGPSCHPRSSTPPPART